MGTAHLPRSLFCITNGGVHLCVSVYYVSTWKILLLALKQTVFHVCNSFYEGLILLLQLLILTAVFMKRFEMKYCIIVLALYF